MVRPRRRGWLNALDLTSHGKRVERAEIGGPGDFDHLTDDELERVLIERLAQLGFALVHGISDGSIALDSRVLPFRSYDE